jgi:hypothetical protein
VNGKCVSTDCPPQIPRDKFNSCCYPPNRVINGVCGSSTCPAWVPRDMYSTCCYPPKKVVNGVCGGSQITIDPPCRGKRCQSPCRSNKCKPVCFACATGRCCHRATGKPNLFKLARRLARQERSQIRSVEHRGVQRRRHERSRHVVRRSADRLEEELE